MFRETRALVGALLARFAVYQGRALLSAVYWSVVAATAIVLRISGRRLLPDTFASSVSHWIERPPFPRDLRSLSRQF